MPLIQVGDVGTVFRITITDGVDPIDISSATTIELIFRTISGHKITKVATFSTDGTDGKIQANSSVGDFQKEEFWDVQAYVVTPTGEWHSQHGQFKVEVNL